MLTFWMLCRYIEVGVGPAEIERMLLLLERRILYCCWLRIEYRRNWFWTFEKLWTLWITDLIFFKIFCLLIWWWIACLDSYVDRYKIDATKILLDPSCLWLSFPFVQFKSTWINVFEVESRMKLLDYQSIMKIINQYDTTHQ